MLLYFTKFYSNPKTKELNLLGTNYIINGRIKKTIFNYENDTDLNLL